MVAIVVGIVYVYVYGYGYGYVNDRLPPPSPKTS